MLITNVSLKVLDHKIAFLKEQSFREARGAADVKDVLEKLKVNNALICFALVGN